MKYQTMYLVYRFVLSIERCETDVELHFVR